MALPITLRTHPLSCISEMIDAEAPEPTVTKIAGRGPSGPGSTLEPTYVPPSTLTEPGAGSSGTQMSTPPPAASSILTCQSPAVGVSSIE